MKTAILKLETLHHVPGLSADFNRQIESLVADCKARPGVTKKRSLKVELMIVPHKEDPEDVVILPVISTKRPATEIDPIRGRRTRAGQLQFDFDDAISGEEE
jgi:hypothetical protein